MPLNLKKFLSLGTWNLETAFGLLGTGKISSSKSRTLGQIFTDRTSFSPESKHESNKIMKFQKILSLLSSSSRSNFPSHHVMDYEIQSSTKPPKTSIPGAYDP